MCLKLTINFTFILTNNKGTKVRKQLIVNYFIYGFFLCFNLYYVALALNLLV